jgi:hypothetical protein
MHYIGKIQDTQMKAFVDNEFKKSYPQVDLFAVDWSEIDVVNDQIENPTVVIYYADPPPFEGLDVFFKLFSNHSDKTFHMFTMPADWTHLANWPSNTHWYLYNFCPHSHDIDDFLGGYRTLESITDKNFSSTKAGICLNRLPRTHRLVSLSYMLGINLDNHCTITAPLLRWYLNNNSVDIMDVVPWHFEDHENFKLTMLKGWERAKHEDGLLNVIVDAYPPYDELAPNQTLFTNPENFINNLTPLYQNSFVEFVTESVYDYDLAFITEKLLNSQLGSNFPIWIGGRGTVTWLREHGCDVFDDVVDHSYDSVQDPVVRMQMCIDKNSKLLKDIKHTQDLWRRHQHRFQQNVNWYKKTYDDLLSKGRKTLESLLLSANKRQF